jgi:type IV pilus assembly protein PilF
MLDFSKHFITLCMAVLMAACATQPNNPYNRDSAGTQRARAHTELGAAYFQQKKYDIALEEFRIAIENDPQYAMAYNGLGMVHDALGENAKADAAFLHSLQIQPNSSESHNNYGNYLCNHGRYDESIKHFLEAVKNPLYETPNLAYTNAGICSVRKNDLANAELYFNRALQIQPLTHSAAYNLALLQFNRGDAITADKTLQTTIIASPTADVLWLGIQIARRLGAKDNEASYAVQLRKLYPNAKETQMLISGQ